MILAAGLGTRLKPFTDHHPKALALVNGKTLLERNLFYLNQYGIKDVIINVHHFADQIEEHLKQEQYRVLNITLSDERNEVLETGGGLKKASWFFDSSESFVLMNADILTNLDLNRVISLHQNSNALATLAVSKRISSRYFLFDEGMQLRGWRNQKTGEERITTTTSVMEEYAFSGIHVIQPSIFKYIHQEGKFSMVDVYLELAKTHLIQGYDHTGSILLDVGKPESISIAETYFK